MPKFRGRSPCPPSRPSALSGLPARPDAQPEAVLGDALESYLHLQEWQIARIRQGLEEARRGETVSHEAVEKWLASWGTENELDPPL